MIESIASTTSTDIDPVPSKRQGTDVPARHSAEGAPHDTVDAVDLSSAARSAEDLEHAQRVQKIRRQIAAGTYLTQDKINMTVERLHAALQAPGQTAATRRVAG